MEYLGKLVFDHEIDPAPIMDQDELEIILKRAGKRLPSRYGITPDIWKEKLLNVIRSKIISLEYSYSVFVVAFSGPLLWLLQSD